MKTKALYRLLAIFCLLLVVLTSCNKSDDPQPQVTVTDPTTIVEGNYTMTYLSADGQSFTLPITTTAGVVAGQLTFIRLTNSSSTARMVVTVNGTPMLNQNPVIYMKLLNQTTVEFYNEAAFTNKIGTGTKNSIDINGTDDDGQRFVMKASR